ncbi:MAG: DUF3077 domain-containing protein, partial [Pseudomonas sp.]|uniref:DUF3077 domain-containing protein n=1 Tax=Pseudomonas sp. TaxID=306 RepID=UPI00271811DB
MSKTNSSAPSDLKTIGFTPLIYCSDQALFNVRAGVPIVDALSQASDLLFNAQGRNRPHHPHQLKPLPRQHALIRIPRPAPL